MKIIHLADTHLGYSAYRKLTSEGINQREVDIYTSFERTIDKIIDSKPDLVLHAGDLFDAVRPTNRAITIALHQMIRLSEKQIPVVLIAGNHETPKLQETGHIFKIFDHVKNIYPIYNNKYELHTFTIDQKKVSIHAIPQCQSEEEFNAELQKVAPDTTAKINIFIAHAAVSDLKTFQMNEFNELSLPLKKIYKNFDYVALGHYHTHTEIFPNVFYAGSTERLSFNEAQDKKGYIELHIEEKIRPLFIEIPVRTMIDFEPINCTNLNLETLTKKIHEKIRNIDPKEKIIRIRLINIPNHIYRGLDITSIRELCKGCIHIEIKSEFQKQDISGISENIKLESLANEFQKYMKTINIPEKEKIKKIGLEYITKIESIEREK
ncbi:MAG: exonuclease SbcCD subunit D [Candidatus Thermoplasmatota archaeon]